MKRILVIDDEPHILLMVKKMLERAGYEVDLASNGSEGIRLFNKLMPVLVITDIIMPEKEGLETIREMKRINSDLKIIAMSGGGKISADNYLETAKIFGASRLIEKPFSHKQLLSYVEELVGPGQANPLVNGDQAQEGLERSRADKRVVAITMILKAFSGRSFTSQIPRNAPAAMAGIINRSRMNDSVLMVFQDQIWRGTLDRLMIKKNQAPVPI
jgi:DNA-binding NtrC family response regulator